MSVLQTFLIAIHTLLRNKVRSFLTTLGVIIGVSAVIAMVTIGEGAKERVNSAFASMGTNLLVILSGTTTRGGAPGGFGTLPTITWKDVEAIRNELSSIRAVSPQLGTRAQVASEEQNWTTKINGVTPEFFDIRKWTVLYGTLFRQSDVDGAKRVAVLGGTVVDELFGESYDPTGRTLRIRNVPFIVIGVLGKKGQSVVGSDIDDSVFIPSTTFQARIEGGGQKYVMGPILVTTNSSDAMERTQKQITELLRDRHHIHPGMDDDFSIRNLTELRNARKEGMKTLTTLGVSIAAVSLLVGGIGIMNIMLVSVAERTREIGVRMAVGAKPRHILAQFLVEALTLAVTGGLIGVGVGLVGGDQLATQLDWPMLIRLDIIILSVVFCALVGVVFGLYPALKASRLNPIEALRYE